MIRARHAFMNEARSEVYEAASPKLAWDCILMFVKNALA
jgi:dienelactone hydrolase